MSNARHWFVRNRGLELGPLTEFEAKLFLAGGTAEHAPRVRAAGQTEWLPPDRFPELLAPLVIPGETEAALAESHRRLHQATEELKTIDQLKNNLIANLGHELRSPLVAARGYTEMIAEGMSGPVTEKQARQLKICLQNLDRLLGLISGLLDFSRLETGKIQLQLRDFDLTRLARGTADLLQPHLAAVKVRLAAELEKTPVPVRGDRTKLEQVLVNLLTNAIKFTPEGGQVTLRIGKSADGKHAEARVSDTGIGIPAAEQGRIFDLFYQVDSSPERRFGGTGLGLSLCREIIRLHHGELTVASASGRGTTFAFTLPLALA